MTGRKQKIRLGDQEERAFLEVLRGMSSCFGTHVQTSFHRRIVFGRGVFFLFIVFPRVHLPSRFRLKTP